MKPSPHQSFWTLLKRKKRNIESESKSKLCRSLNLIDLIALGIGATLGLGVYVLAGTVARETAGPAVILSFLFAGIASTFSGEEDFCLFVLNFNFIFKVSVTRSFLQEFQ
jgi:solute carrier family 7 (cationic amino acid transporter), member 3